MITCFKTTDSGLEIMSEPVTGSWLNAVDPTQEEIAQMHALGIPQDYITYSLDMDERARTERENGELLILLRVPIYQGESEDVPYATIPLGIITTDKYIVTVCRRNSDILQELLLKKHRDLSTTKRNRFILRVLLSTANRYLHFLREINKIVEGLEDQLQASTRNKEVLELLKYQKSLTYFTTALKSNELTMERLQRGQFFKMYPDDEDLLEDVLTENQQAIEMTNIAGNILSQMMDAFASIIANNLNAVMKVLASITIVLSLPTMIASFFGMNLHLPLQDHPLAFLGTLGISFMASLGVVYIFIKRDWF
jgi:magnesium transporter